MKTLEQIGEFGLIERLARKIKVDKSVICGIGDDAAVISYTRDKYLLLTTDMFIEGVHFRKREASFFQIGRKAMVANISDIAAMGGIPRYAVVAIGLPGETRIGAVDDIMCGLNQPAKDFAINIVGGDTVRAHKLALAVSLVGEVKKADLTLRSGARVGNLIFVTGNLGGSRRLKQFNFIPRVKEAQYIVKKYKPTAMIDLSDGIASDMQRIAKQSKVGVIIFEQLLPLSRGASIESALYEGEDFELLFTLSIQKARQLYQKGKIPLTCIGKIVERNRGLSIIDRQARVRPLKKVGGFKHF